MQEVGIIFKGIDLVVRGYYSPEEAQVMYYSDGSGYPGCSAEFEIQEITLKNDDTNLFELLEDYTEKIEELAIEEFENYKRNDY